MNRLQYRKKTVSSQVRPLFLEVWSIVRVFVAPLIVVLLFLAMWLAIPDVLEASISNPVSGVDPGWSNNRKRAVFYNGDRFFLLYYKGGSILYYQSSTDNVTWSGESTLMSGPTSVFDIYLVSDTKFDLVYKNSANTHRVATCTISGATITAGSSSTWLTAVASPEVVVARSGGGDRIYVASGAGDTLRIYSADQTGDAENVTSWTQELSAKESPEDIAMVPYQNSDQVLVINSEFKNDGIYSQLVTYDSGRIEVEIGDFSNLPDFSSPVRISDTDFRIIIRPPGAAMEEWKWNGSAWIEVETVDAETDQDTPSLFYDRISGDMYVFSIDTTTDDVERHKKLSGDSWQDQPEEIADDGELTTHTFPITQMHEPPYGSSRSVPRVLVWAYRVGTSPYDLKVGALGLAPTISSDADQVFEVGQVATEISKITITEPGAPTITAGNDLRIAIDPGVAMVWDTSVTTATFGGTGSGNVSNPVSYDPSGRVLIIPVNPDFAALETLTIEGLYFTNFATANPAKSGIKVFLGGAGDTVAESWDVKTIMIKGIVTLGDHTQGQVGDKFTGQTESATTTEYFRFQLENNGEPASTTLTVDLSSINGIVTGDVTDVQLWADVDGLGDVTAADAAGVWTTYDKSPVTSMFSLTFDSANNVLYAGASNGTIYRCDTATGCDENGDWTVSFPTPENQIRSVFFDSANNVIYAGSNPGGIIYRCDTASGCDETDGSEWVEVYNTSAVSIYAFTLDSANNVIYAASSEIGAATIYRCDASTGCDRASEWTISHSTTLDIIYSLTFDSVNNVLYAGTSNSGIIYRCDTSTGCDETTDWTTSYDTPATSIYSLTFESTNKILYAGSSDGIIYRCDPSTGCDQGSTDWTTAFTTGEFYVWAITLDTINNVLYAGTGGSTKIFSCDTSTGCDDDASEWLLNYDPSVGGNINSLAFDSTHDVIHAGASSGKISRRFEGDYRVGGGNFLWTERTAANGYTNWFRGVAHDGTGKWVAVGTDGEIQSWDGIAATWTKETPAASYSNYFEAVAHDGTGLWVAVGMDGEIQSSTDGSTWIEETIEGTFSNVFNGVAHDGVGQWVAVGSQGEIQSWDGIAATWTQETPAASYGGSFFGVAHDGAAKWVAVGMSGEIQSWDGSAGTWTQEATGGTNFYEVAYDGTGLWVAVGSGGKIETSPDGSSWTPQTAAAGYADAFYGIAYDAGAGLWTAVGSYGEIQTSPNGSDWTRRFPAEGYTDSFRGVAHGAGLWTAVGIGGEIQTSCGLLCGGPVSISGSTGTITFSEAPLPAGTMDYLLRATISNIEDGDTITFGLSPSGVVATGEVSGQSLSVSGSAASRTHTRGVPAEPNLTQIHYRWRNDNGDESAATWPVNEDTALSILSVNTPMRLRFEISNEGTAESLSTEYLLEYATSTGGPWEAVPVSATTEHWEMVNSTYFTDGASTSNIVPGLSDENNDFFLGKLKDTSNQTAGITLLGTEFTEIEYCIGATANVTPPETYYFRLTNAGTPLDSYIIYGRVTVGNSGPWFDSNWPFRKLLRIDSSRVAGDLANFPVLINTTDENLIFSGSPHAVNHVRQSDGGDIVFTTEVGVKLDHEIEKYEPSTGELVAWVEVPSVFGSSDTFIYIYYGYASAGDQWDVNGTWDEEGDNYYEGVWHLNESPNDGDAEHVDSTGNLNVGTPQNFQDGGGGTTAAAGKIGGADSFAGDDDEVRFFSNAIVGSSAQWTLTAWMKTASADKQTIYGEGNLSTGNYLYIDKESSSYVEFYFDGPPDYPLFNGTKNVEDNEWHHVAIVQTSQIYRELFVDGLSDGTNTEDGGTPTYDTASIGLLRTMGWTADPFEGIIDEVRVSHTPRTADWIATEYNNQFAPASFYTVGIEETEGTGGDPLSNGWSYRKQITIPASEVPSDQTNFPVLVRRTDADWAYTGGGHVGQDDGGDIVFMASDGIIKLDHEIERYIDTSGELVTWVEVPSLSGSVDTVIYIYYGNSSAVDQENPTGAGVWDNNYVGVWHLDETPSHLGTHDDSSRNGNTGTWNDSNSQGNTNATGRIDGADDFDGSDDYVDLSTTMNPQTYDDFTISAWYKSTDASVSDDEYIYNHRTNSTNEFTFGPTDDTSHTDQLRLFIERTETGAGANYYYSTTDVVDQTWHYLAAVRTPAERIKIYVDDTEELDDPGDTSGTFTWDGLGPYIGDWPGATEQVHGILDEVRVSNIARTYDWILTEYNNQKISSTFYNVGDECDGSATTFSYRRLITINASQVSNTEAPDYLTDFPVLVSLSHATLKSTADGGYVQHSQGYDIIFRDLNGVYQLDHEIEEYDGSAGTLVAWVRVPTVSKTSNTLIYMYYGNCGISSRTENPAGVWSNGYVGVWHLDESPANGVAGHDDSTGNPNDGTPQNFGTMSTSTTDPATDVPTWSTDKKIDGADVFDGVDDSISVSDSASLDITTNITLSAWVYLTASPGQYVKVLAKNKITDYPYQLHFASDIDDKIRFQLDGVGNVSSLADIPQDEWVFIAATYDAITQRLYINGVQNNTNPATAAIATNDELFYIGGRSVVSYYTIPGSIDEVRVSSTARTADWIKTSHTNQNTPGNIDTPGFYTVGNEDTPAATAVDLISFTATGNDDTVLVEWETAQEVNNLGFNLYRSTESNGSYTKRNKQLIPGLISSVTGRKYSYSDTDVIRGVLYYYLLEDVDLSGMRTMHGPVCVDWDGDGIPDDYIEEPDDDNDDSDEDNDDSEPEVKIPDLEFYEVDFGPEGWTPSSNVGSDTWVKLASFRASQEDEGVSLEWETSYEVDSLGFHIYREADSKFYRITTDLVPGSVFKVGASRELPAGQSYVHWDGLSGHTGRELYWLDCVGLNGVRASFGPIKPEGYGKLIPERLKARFRSIARHQASRAREVVKIRALREELSTRQAQVQKSQTIFYKVIPENPSGARLPPSEEQWALSAQPGLKIYIKEDGWYRIGEMDLVEAGLDSGVDPRYLQLYADGEEQSIMVTGSEDGRFDPEDAIEFYGIGIDTPYSDSHVYWLVVGERTGRRFDTPFTDIRLAPYKRMRIPRGLRGRGAPLSFPFSVELKERTFYFAALRNGEGESFFGSVISTEPVEQLLTVMHADPSPPEEALLEVVLQGATDFAHQIKILLNYAEVGEVVFNGQEREEVEIRVPYNLLLEGENIVTLAAQRGDLDISLVDYIRLTYWRTYTANDDALKFTAMAREWVTIEGFSSELIRAVDITDPMGMFSVLGKVRSYDSGYAITFKVPGHGQRNLLVFTEEKIKRPSSTAANLVSSWHEREQGAEVVIIAHGDLLESIEPLKELREEQGWSVVLVDVEDLYDEFNFGAKSPWALKSFLARAYESWVPQPHFVLLVGDTSYDPRNYLGFGDFDLLPTKFVDTEYLKTASDDWFVDFNDDGLPEMAVGRLPVESAEEAVTVVSKIISYEGVAGLMNEALLVADSNDGFDFEGACGEVRSLLPGGMTVSEIFRGQSPTARTDLLDLLNQGQLLVNYFGHGSTTIWKGNLLTSLDAWSLNNSPYLPFLVSMTCLNGFFQDPYSESMAETFLKADWGGAVAVWTSSGLTDPAGQLPMNKELITLLFNGQGLTIGEAIMGAKRAAANGDIRRTWILFGDPTLRLR